MMTTLSTIAFILIIVSLIIQIIFLIINKEAKPDPISHYVIAVSFILLIIYTVLMSLEINFIAITNTYEAMFVFSEMILLVILVYRFSMGKNTNPFIMLGVTMISIILLAIASSPIIPHELHPPIPALQSYWLIFHIIFAFIGESFFAMAFVASIYLLVVKDEEKKKNADRITYISIIIGYFLYTAGGLIFGAIWANVAWGRYWGWDPKETWALVTFLVYTVYLHLRLIAKVDRKITSIVSIAGFLFAIFTFFGVNYLLAGLHSYG
jgi:ABC-type transport system involved in cytochrome c biogenesis permease subunit